jgi:hypothetical protein
MRKAISKKKQQISSKAKRETREGLEFYIGIDLGDKNSDVCVLDRRGELSKEFRLRIKEEDFQTYFASIPRSRVSGGSWCPVKMGGGDHRKMRA